MLVIPHASVLPNTPDPRQPLPCTLPLPSKHNGCRADKVIANEQARAKSAGSSASKATVASSEGKGKGKAQSKHVCEETSNGEEEGGTTRKVVKKVGKSARNTRTVVSSHESSLAPTPAPKHKAGAKSAAPEPPQELPAQKWKIMPKMGGLCIVAMQKMLLPVRSREGLHLNPKQMTK
ncbi:hypothetical protein FRC06_002873 [Ceratobasidium sp. 370]|nr:hypothetical protein FRC06_002873 [Ceratobasidium sp. 370]